MSDKPKDDTLCLWVLQPVTEMTQEEHDYWVVRQPFQRESIKKLFERVGFKPAKTPDALFEEWLREQRRGQTEDRLKIDENLSVKKTWGGV